jgi:hypothetical protein
MPELAPPCLFPDDCVDPKLLKRAVYKCMSDGSYHHDRFRQVFLTAGFGVRQVERDECPPVWQIKLLRGTFELSREQVEAARQIRRLLKANGLPVERNAINAISVILSGDQVTCSFVSTAGGESVSS